MFEAQVEHMTIDFGQIVSIVLKDPMNFGAIFSPVRLTGVENQIWDTVTQKRFHVKTLTALSYWWGISWK